jgi:hypothetical protein
MYCSYVKLEHFPICLYVATGQLLKSQPRWIGVYLGVKVRTTHQAKEDRMHFANKRNKAQIQNKREYGLCAQFLELSPTHKVTKFK